MINIPDIRYQLYSPELFIDKAAKTIETIPNAIPPNRDLGFWCNFDEDCLSIKKEGSTYLIKKWENQSVNPKDKVKYVRAYIKSLTA